MTNRAWRCIAWMFISLWCSFAGAQTQREMRLVHAHVIERFAGQVTERDVELPYHWDAEHPGVQGEAEFIVPVNLQEIPQDALGILLIKVGNAYSVRFNDQVVEAEGDLVHYNGADYSQVPRHMLVPPSLLRPNNMLRIRIRADAGRRGGLSVIDVGPAEVTYAEYLSKYHWRSSATLAIAVFSGFVSLIAFSLWATQLDPLAQQPQRDNMYLYAGLAELFWTFGTGYILFQDPPVQWPLWGVMSVGSTIVWSVFMSLFCMEVAGWKHGAWAVGYRRASITLACLSVALTWWSLSHQQPMVLTAVYLLLALNFASFCTVFVVKSLRGGNTDQYLIAVSVLINVAVGVRDIYVFRLQPSYGVVTWLRYSSVLFGLTLLYVLITRFKTASQQSRELLSTLSERVAERERELNSSFVKLEAMARHQERVDERSRILRDMHDGVGAHLSSAIRQLQSGQSTNEVVLQTLKESLDYLKLSIDAMNLVPGDITSLLANLRYRLSPRFEAMNIALEWDVQELPLLQRLDANAMRQLQFIIYEAFSNALQHAHATTITIIGQSITATDGQTPSEILVRIADNGCGFDTHAPGRKGLAAMAARATAIGAALEISSQPGLTAVELRFPVPAP